MSRGWTAASLDVDDCAKNQVVGRGYQKQSAETWEWSKRYSSQASLLHMPGDYLIIPAFAYTNISLVQGDSGQGLRARDDASRQRVAIHSIMHARKLTGFHIDNDRASVVQSTFKVSTRSVACTRTKKVHPVYIREKIRVRRHNLHSES